MFLKLKVSCNCRCSYYLNEAISADKISCPNCGKEHPYSKKFFQCFIPQMKFKMYLILTVLILKALPQKSFFDRNI